MAEESRDSSRRKVPPPLPERGAAEGVWLSYVRFAVIVVPAALFLGFCAVFLFPKVEVMWGEAGLSHSRAAWLMQVTDQLISNGRFLLVGGIGGLALLEVFWKPWTRWRAWGLTMVAAAFNLFVLTTLTATLMAGFLAAPMLIKKAEKERVR